MHAEFHSSSPKIVVVMLDRQVFGGPQAVEFNAMINEYIEKGGRTIIIDLSQVDLMNSSGLGMLVSSLTSVRKHGGSIRLAAIPAKVENLLQITRLNTVFESYPSVEDAVLGT